MYIIRLILKLNLVVYPVNTYFDFNNMVQPVQQFIDDTFFWPILPTMGKQSFFYLRQSFTSLSDQFFSFSNNGNNYTLYSIRTEKDTIQTIYYKGITYVSVQIRLDPY